MLLQEEIKTYITYLKSANTAQSYLYKCYLDSNIEEAEKKSFENTYRFIYYLEHGESFFDTGNKADLIVKPILFFYGLVHLLKACLLTKRPEYPENTGLLAHGVSTRKRKKQNYSFLQDEVKPQHNGLFPYFSKHLFHVEQPLLEKIEMNKLLHNIPEMRKMYLHHKKNDSMVPIGRYGDTTLSFPLRILDNYHMTLTAFSDKLRTNLSQIKKIEETDGDLIVELNSPLNPLSKSPIFLDYQRQLYFFPINRYYFLNYDELMLHYLLLYNLSMICRYETEWWGDLIHTFPNEDYPYITHFLSVSSKKIPLMLGMYLYRRLMGN
jgi:hypothetical protein